jgi:hypothetical protein
MWNGKTLVFKSFRASSTGAFFLHCAHQLNKTWRDMWIRLHRAAMLVDSITDGERDAFVQPAQVKGRRASSSATYASVDVLVESCDIPCESTLFVVDELQSVLEMCARSVPHQQLPCMMT